MKKIMAFLCLFYSATSDAKLTIPYVFASATTISSTQVNANFSATASELNSFENIVYCISSYGSDTGSANAYVVSVPGCSNPLIAGISISFLVANSNTGSSTINVNGLGVYSLTLNNGNPPNAGQILAGSILTIAFDGAKFQIVSGYQLSAANFSGNIQPANGGTGINTGSSTGVPSVSSGIWSISSLLSSVLGGTPSGSIMAYAGTACPGGYVAANGALLSTSTYATLYAAIGTTYGSGSGTFAVPDLRGIFARGAGTNGTLTEANGGNFASTQGTYYNDMIQGHEHYRNPAQASEVWLNGTGSYTFASQTSNDTVGSGTNTGVPVTDGTNGTPRAGAETRPANVSVLYCIKT